MSDRSFDTGGEYTTTNREAGTKDSTGITSPMGMGFSIAKTEIGIRAIGSIAKGKGKGYTITRMGISTPASSERVRPKDMEPSTGRTAKNIRASGYRT